MKILLTAFGKKLQGEMEWPDSVEPRVYLMMDMETPKVFNHETQDYSFGTTLKKATFEWQGEEGFMGRRVYKLIDVS
jgi:hypothetical protein